MNYKLVCKQFFQAFSVAFVLLSAVYALRGRPAILAATEAGIWALVSAVIYSAVVVRNIRRNAACTVGRE